MTRNGMRVLIIGLVGLGLVTAGAAQEKKPAATVTVESKSVAVGVGVSWGDGVLTYQGKTHKFSVSGLSVADLGVSKVSAKGEVYNLKKLGDFSGTYAAAAAGAAVGAGAGAIAMKNQNGVEMVLTGTGKGIQLTLAAKGIEVKLK